MRILFVILDSEPQIAQRSVHLLCALASRGHNLTLITTAEWTAGELDSVLRHACDQVLRVGFDRRDQRRALLRALPGDLPLQAGRYFAPPLLTAIQREVRRQPYDLLHLAGLSAAALGYAAGRIPVVFDAVQCLTLRIERHLRHNLAPPRRLAAAFGVLRLRRYEMIYPLAFDQILVADADAAWALQTLSGQLQRRLDDGFEASDRERQVTMQQMAALTKIHVLRNGNSPADWATAAQNLEQIYRRASGTLHLEEPSPEQQEPSPQQQLDFLPPD